MGCKNHDDHTNCVCDVVNFINDLQDAVEEDENNCPTNCLNPVLGANSHKKHHHRKNTRPFILYTEDGPFEAFFKPTDGGCHDCPCEKDGKKIHDKIDFFCKSIFFRVENVEGCCAVLRVLEPECTTSPCPQIDRPEENLHLSESCITVDLRNFIAIQCLDDIHLPNC
ncbi:CotY/CotZ family spore coat protein [Heyndrickxia oleronia]|uniref:CotY/CotZ family spore coat protein n=1 Tax=Heyndrickxia oleronia TaxID=38875 RepID=UPI00203E3AFE|nr:CotY/CotZ family spore coat protein [Heyndrickxia oleronia]MCM3237985.1 CotY/CotZ family spore coat protein [Heyndrickxia oleronia]